MNGRLYELRKALKLSQKAFGVKMGLSDSAVSNMESGRYKITDTVLKLACQEFSVNEEWLRTGAGEMFTAVPSEELEKLAERYKLSGIAQRFVKTFVELEEREMSTVLNFMVKVVSGDGGNITAENDEEFASERAYPAIDKWEAETNRVQAIIDAQKAIDERHNKNQKKEKLSSYSM